MTGAEFEGVDLDLLADYAGGALDGTPDEQRVAALVADDPAWRAAYEQLLPAMSTVGAMLLDLPPEPMPDDLSARLDSLFATPAAEVPASDETAADTPGESADPVPAKVLDLEERRRDRAARTGRRRWSRWAAPATVAAGVIAFAGFGLNWLGGQAEDTSAGSTAAEHAAPAADRAAPMLAGSAPPAEIRHSGVDYTRQTLTQIAAAWSAPPQPVSGSGGPAAEMNSLKGDLGRLLAPDLLLACLDAIAQENGDGPITAQIVDYATFEGAPALIVQFSADNGIWAWAVGPECGTRGAGAASLARLPVR